MNWWFVAYIAIQLLGLYIANEKHGETVVVKFNFWTTLFSTTLYLLIVYNAILHGF